jgi:hypothetical protein
VRWLAGRRCRSRPLRPSTIISNNFFVLILLGKRANFISGEIAAITGHASLKEVERYTATASRAKLAIAAMKKVVG